MLIIINNSITQFLNKKLNIKKNSYIFLLYIFILFSFNYSSIKSINKLCEDDMLFNLYTMSSNTITIWVLLTSISILCLRNLKVLYSSGLFFFYFFVHLYNINSVELFFNTNSVNTTLQNGLLNIHPIYVYITYAFSGFCWFTVYKSYNLNNFNHLTATHLFGVFCIIVSGIYLGSFWASQELNWGGFWSWDPVELVSLFLFFLLLMYFHDLKERLFNKPLNHIIIVLFIVYFVIRLGIVNTIHSFIRSNSTPLIVIGITILLYISILVNALRYKSLYKYTHPNLNSNINTFLLTCLYVYCIDIITNLNTTNINLMYIYIIVLLSSIMLYYIIFKSIKITKEFFVLYAIIAIMLSLKNSYLFIQLFIIFFVSGWFFLKKNHLHTYLLLCYIIFFIFFIQVNTYNHISMSHVKLNVYLTNTTNSTTIQELYETTLSLKKQNVFLNLKNIMVHINGFSINTNTIVGAYTVCKNNNMYTLFNIDLVYVVFIYILFLCVSNLTNYKFSLKTYKFML